MKKLCKILSMLAMASAFTVTGWLLPACSKDKNKNESQIDEGQTLPEEQEQTAPNGGELTVSPDISPEERENNGQNEGETNGENNLPAVTDPRPAEQEEKPVVNPEEKPVENKAEYIKITSDGVNIRSGAGTSYSSLGVAEKNTLYAVKGKTGNWYKTVYRHKTAYISANYCTTVNMDKCASDKLEAVIENGYECLGVPYVYGAVRYMDGNGNKLSGFTKDAFDCSSLMQYIFKLGAGTNLQVNTRTQVYQGTTVSKSNLRRGDLIFFTNASRKNLTGVERVGHVALYLGDNYILHTASDYAKIEQISTTRWGYYIQAQRMI